MATQHDRIGFWPLALSWALTAALYGARALANTGRAPLITDTDDAMRLTMVHDLLNGQGWFDLTQHRMNTPYGGPMHWSRLIDLPEATLLLILRPLLGAGIADTVAAYVWPLLLLLPLIWLSGKIALSLGGRSALWPALLLPAPSMITLAEFSPGRVDHHSVQILLALTMLYCALTSLERPRFAIGAGVAAAVALAIGTESLPVVGAIVLAFGLAWASDRRHAIALRDFGLSFALGTMLALAQGVAPDRWLDPAIDAISIVYAMAAILCAIAFLLLSRLDLKPAIWRLAVGLVAGGIATGVLVALYPAILRGPYGQLDPWIVENWLSRVAEAEPWLKSLLSEPVYPIAVLVPSLVALLVSLRNAIRQPQKREAWFTYALVLAATMLVMLLQIRAARIAVPLAVPGCAWLIGSAWRRMVSSRGFRPILAMIGSVLISSSIAVAIVATAIVLAFPDYSDSTEDKFGAARNACLMPEAFADLAGLPPERIMAPVDLGAHILLYTPHSMVSGPYHRNQTGVRDVFRFFNAPIDEARSILEQRGISLVVICPAMSEIRGMIEHASDSFVTLYAEQRLPVWLVDQSLPASPLKIYAVLPR